MDQSMTKSGVVGSGRLPEFATRAAQGLEVDEVSLAQSISGSNPCRHAKLIPVHKLSAALRRADRYAASRIRPSDRTTRMQLPRLVPRNVGRTPLHRPTCQRHNWSGLRQLI